MNSIVKTFKYLLVAIFVVTGVLMHVALTALLFSDSKQGEKKIRRPIAVRATKQVRRKTHVSRARVKGKSVSRATRAKKTKRGKVAGTKTRRVSPTPLPGNPVTPRIIETAARYLGTPYVWGGSNPKEGFDCSGFTQYVYRESGIAIPRTAREQFDALRSTNEPMPGDLVFFAMDGNDINHVGIYIGKGRFIHSPRTGDVLKYASLDKMYWRTRYLGAGAAF